METLFSDLDLSFRKTAFLSVKLSAPMAAERVKFREEENWVFLERNLLRERKRKK